MQRRRLGYIAALMCLVVGVGSAVAQPNRPSVGLVSVHPLIVRGSHFKPEERVLVVVAARGTKWTRKAVALAPGTFVTRFGERDVTRCELTIRALGSRGSIALLKPGPPACGGENG